MKAHKVTTMVGGLFGPAANFSNNLKFLHRFLLTLLASQFFLPCFVSASSCNPSDRDSLWYFYNSTAVTTTLNWSTTADCCLWEGVHCQTVANGNNRVTQLLLPSRGLRGDYLSSLRNLTHLSHLDLSHNRLYGSFPSDFFSTLNFLQFLNLSFNLLTGQLPPVSSGGNISKLMEILDLSSNRFSGTIPASFIQQVAISGSLTSFNVSNNSFTGSIPTSFCLNTNPSTSSLRSLDFSSNEFIGQITRGLGNCSSLEVFRAGFNTLSGPIPSDLSNAVTLKEVSLQVNHLSGRIGFGIVNLTNLKILQLYSNSFTGPIPPDIGKLSKLEQMLLHVNSLTGTLPTSLMNCTHLTLLNLRVNKLQGDLSAVDFSRLLRLTTLDLGSNMFTGSLPLTLYACKSLKAIRLSRNQLSGEISSEIAALQSLSFLSIPHNQLTNLTGALKNLMGCRNLGTLVLGSSYYGEKLPDEDIILDGDTFQSIQLLALGGCHLTGNVPSWIAKLRNLEVLDLSYNRLGGSIPAWLGDLPSLFYIDLSNNQISGEFPINLCRLQALLSLQILDRANKSYLALPIFVAPNNATIQQYNQFSSLPPAINLGNNTLSGIIPIEIGQLKTIHVLDLSNNSFSGSIPDTFSNLNNLERLDLSRNHLTGKIPNSLKGLHFLSWFRVAFNDLQGPIPTGGQFDTFPSSSYEGNPGLCGRPIVQHSCYDETGFKHSTAEDESSRESTDVLSTFLSPPCLIFSILTFVLAFLISFFVSISYY